MERTTKREDDGDSDITDDLDREKDKVSFGSDGVLITMIGVGRERMEFPATQPSERDHRGSNGNTRRKDSDCVIL